MYNQIRIDNCSDYKYCSSDYSLRCPSATNLHHPDSYPLSECHRKYTSTHYFQYRIENLAMSHQHWCSDYQYFYQCKYHRPGPAHTPHHHRKEDFLLYHHIDLDYHLHKNEIMYSRNHLGRHRDTRDHCLWSDRLFDDQARPEISHLPSPTSGHNLPCREYRYQNPYSGHQDPLAQHRSRYRPHTFEGSLR